MTTGSTSVSIANEALAFIGSQTVLVSLTDGQLPGNPVNILYQPTVQLMLREIDPDFARTNATLNLLVSPANIPAWTYEYEVPADMVRLRIVRPPFAGPGSEPDGFDPQPVRFMVDFDTVASVPQRVILSNQQNAIAVYTSNSPAEALWDAAFQDAVVRRLANPLAMALAGRPDFADHLLASSAQMAQTAGMVEDSGFRSFA